MTPKEEAQNRIRELLSQNNFPVQKSIDWLVESKLLISLQIHRDGKCSSHIAMFSGQLNTVEGHSLTVCLACTLSELLEELEDGLDIDQGTLANVIPMVARTKNHPSMKGT